MFQIKWLWKNLKGYQAAYVMALVFSIACNCMFLISPILAQNIVDMFISGENAAQNLETSRDTLVLMCLGMVGFALIRNSLQYSTIMIYEMSSQAIVYRVRNFLYQKVQHQDMDFHNKNRTGDLMTRLSGDLDWIRHAVAYIFRVILESVTLFIVCTVYFFTLDPIMAICLLAVTPLIFFISSMFRKEVHPKYVELRERLSELNTAAQENISGNRVVKAFAMEDYENEKFNKKSEEFFLANRDASFTWLKYYPYLETTAQALSVIQLLVGGLFVMSGRLTTGEFIAFSGLTWALANPMRMFGGLINELQRFQVSTDKIIEIYYSSPRIVNRVDAIDHPHRFKGNVEFKNVTFKYGNKVVLDSISLNIKAGQTVAIMGETGSGKTSLVNLIPRFYDANEGSILVDDINVKTLKIEELRGNIGIATQDILLYSDTIEGNIAYGDSKMPIEEVYKYAEIASADGFIRKMPEGYDTIVGERGVGLSGGQKQRISLARALAVKPSILILDDTTSAVDLETEKYIQHGLNNLEFECTKIIIAQRISSTKNADNIIILKDGKISEMGTHDELLKHDGYYSDVYNLQHGPKTVNA